MSAIFPKGMEFNAVLKMLEGNAAFREWRVSHADFFCAHGFVMLDEVNENSWQIVFFSVSKQVMTTFVVSGGGVEMVQDQEVLKGVDEIVPLRGDEVKVSVDGAVASARSCLEKEYGGAGVINAFFILQQTKTVPWYNITFLLRSLVTVNVKVSAVDGVVISHSKAALATFQ